MKRAESSIVHVVNGGFTVVVETYYFGIEEIEEDHYCPGCGLLFDKEHWEDVGRYHYPRSGGRTDYECPDCESNTISVQI